MDSNTEEGQNALRMVLTDPAKWVKFKSVWHLDRRNFNSFDIFVCRYVLKPQREGGGNNVYGHDIPDALRVGVTILLLLRTVDKTFILMFCILNSIVLENVGGGAFSVDSNGAHISANFERIHDSTEWAITSATCWLSFRAWYLRCCYRVCWVLSTTWYWHTQVSIDYWTWFLMKSQFFCS